MAFKTQVSKRQNLSSESPDAIKGRAVKCIQAASIACYAYTIAAKARETAQQARSQASLSSEVARNLTEIVEMLKKEAQAEAKAFGYDNQTLLRLYASAGSKPISFYKFMAIVKPTEDVVYYENEDDNSEASRYALQTSTSLERCDVFNIPHLQKVKSISEYKKPFLYYATTTCVRIRFGVAGWEEFEFSGNILSISDHRRKMTRIQSPRSPSPLLCKEDAESVQKKTSPSTSQQSGFQLHKYSLRASRSSKSLEAERSAS